MTSGVHPAAQRSEHIRLNSSLTPFERVAPMRIGAGVTFVLILCSLIAVAVARADSAMVSKPVGHYFLYGGLNVRVDSIQTLVKQDKNPVLQSVNGANDPDKGYVIVHLSIQNPSSADDRPVQGNRLSFELQDGTQMDFTDPAAVYVGTSFAAPPNSLHPKQTMQFTYVILNWPHSPITKMFMKCVSCDDEAPGNLGAQYVLFAIEPGYVTELAPMP
jgi:hypothetical protein